MAPVDFASIAGTQHPADYFGTQMTLWQLTEIRMRVASLLKHVQGMYWGNGELDVELPATLATVLGMLTPEFKAVHMYGMENFSGSATRQESPETPVETSQ